MSARDLFEKLQAFGAHIAPHLSGPWRLDRRPVDEDRLHCGVVILGPDHLALRLQDGERLGHKSMIRIAGQIPDFGLSYEERRAVGVYASSSGGINVSWHRSPQSIAGDITRRLMPALCGGHSSGAETCPSSLEPVWQRSGMLSRLYAGSCRICAITAPNQFEMQRRYSFPGEGEYRTHKLELSGYNGVRCDLELRDLDPDMTVRILVLLRENKRGGI